MHTSMLDNVKKLVLSVSVVVLFALYAEQRHATSTTGVSNIAAPSDSSSTAGGASGKPAVNYRDGVYTGDSIDAHWGDVEVRTTISGGTISKVDVLTYPNHRERSVEINQHALPILTKEVIQSQRSDVDVVTGATDTSDAFIYSLESTLDQATA